MFGPPARDPLQEYLRSRDRSTESTPPQSAMPPETPGSGRRFGDYLLENRRRWMKLYYYALGLVIALTMLEGAYKLAAPLLALVLMPIMALLHLPQNLLWWVLGLVYRRLRRA